jgi:plastocyanin
MVCAALGALAQLASAGNLQVSVLDKEGKPVADAVAVVGVGAKGLFVNNDPWEHHVRASAAGVAQFNAAAGEGFELRLDGKAEGKAAKSAEATFDKAGAVLLGCHLHASMRGHVFVSDSPWAALTNVDGVAMFEAVPDGATRVRVWHADQLIDIPQQQVALTAAPAKTTMQLSVVPRRRRI